MSDTTPIVATGNRFRRSAESRSPGALVARQEAVLTESDVKEISHDWACFFGKSTEGGASICIRDVERRVLSKLRAPVAEEAQPTDEEIMTKVQEFASTWAIVDGRFDDGSAMEHAEQCKEEIKALLSRRAAPQAREAVQLLRKVRDDGYLSDTMNHRIAVYFACQPQACEADAAALSTAVDYRRMEVAQVGAGERLAMLAAALGNRDWKWWDSCSFRRLTFEDGPDRRDGSALHGTVQASDGHPDVCMAPGVREFIEAASPQAIGLLCSRVDRLASQLRECAGTLGADLVDEHRASRAYADCQALLQELEDCTGGNEE